MSDFKVNVDLLKLKAFLPSLTIQQKALIKEQGGITLNFESEYDDEVYHQLYEGLSEIFIRYNLIDHINELYYIIIVLDNNFVEVKYLQEQTYDDDKTAREVAQFLLTVKNNKPKQSFQLTAKSLTETGSIKNPEVAKWLGQLIYDAIEARKMPVDTFGESIYLRLFGDNPLDGKPISMERLKSTAELSIRKPKYTNLLFNIALQIRTYLNTQTNMKTADNVLLADSHANFIFDVFDFMGYINSSKIQSEPKDYIHALFRNQLKSY